MATTRCPHCFKDLRHDPRTAFTCSGKCGPPGPRDSKADVYGTPQVQRVTTVRGDPMTRPTSSPCEVCGKVSSVEVCPTCNFTLPRNWRSSATTCVAMTGARATGKSFYIAVMKRQMEVLFNLEGGIPPFEFAEADSRLAFEERYEKPVKRERLLDPTLPAGQLLAQRAPLIFQAGLVGDLPHRLVIRDVAGEDLERGDLTEARFDFLASADTLIFLIDPMRVNAVRQMLEGIVPIPSDAELGAAPETVLNRVLEKVSDGSRGRPRPQVSLALSKFDVLQALGQVEASPWSQIMQNRGAAFLRDPSLKQFAYDEEDGRLLHEETRSLLELLGAGSLPRALGAAGVEGRLFTVSALGEHGVNEGLHPRGISPFRCADPLKWALANSGVLPRL